MRIAIITGSTRPGRRNLAVAQWVLELAAKRTDATFELVDINDHELPLLDEAALPASGRYTQPHTKQWAAKIASFDGFVFVTPEYNHGTSGALKNAIDYLYVEWNNKAAGFVGYGGNGGARAIEQLRSVMGCLMIADVTAHVTLSLFSDFDESSRVRAGSHQDGKVHAMLDQVISWSRALATLRSPSIAKAA